MKYFIIAAFLVILTSELAQTEKRCSTNEDCGEDECCLNRIFGFFRKGDCTGRAKEGESCSHEDDSFRDKYILHCPCVSGLSCEPEETKDTIFGKLKINERCVEGTTTEGEIVTEATEGEVLTEPAEE